MLTCDSADRTLGYPPQQDYTRQQGYPPQGQHQQQQYQQGYQDRPQYGQQQQHYSSQPGKGQQAAPEVNDSGTAQGIPYSIKHRNAFSILELRLKPGDAIKSVPGAMVHMSATVTITGKVKVGFKKLFTGGEMAESTYTGPGTVALTPTMIGDIVSLEVNGNSGRPWLVTKNAYLACTAGVDKDTKAQGLGKAMFSGSDLFVYSMRGQGTAWLTSYGAVEAVNVRSLRPTISERALTYCLATTWRAAHRGQWSSRGMELRVQHRACGRWNLDFREDWRRVGLPLHRTWDGLLPDAELG